MHRLLTSKEEQALLVLAGDGNRDAVAVLVECNQALVINIAYRYYLKRSYQTMDDLVQWGNVGLLRAIEKWDGRNGRFSTYATYWIRAFIQRNADHGMFSMSNRDSLYAARVYRSRSHLYKILEREPRPDEIAAYVNLSVEIVNRSIEMLRKSIDIDQEIESEDRSDGSNPLLIETIQSGDIPTEINAENNVLLDQIRSAVNKLSSVQRQVINRRYLDSPPATLGELSDSMHVSRQYIYQVERDALIALRILLSSQSDK